MNIGEKRSKRVNKDRQARHRSPALLGVLVVLYAAVIAPAPTAAAPVASPPRYEVDHKPLKVHGKSDGWAEYPEFAVNPGVVALAYSLRKDGRSEVYYRRIVRGSGHAGEPLPIDDGDRNEFRPSVDIMGDESAWVAWASYLGDEWNIKGLVDDLTAPPPAGQMVVLEVYGGDGFNSQVRVDCGDSTAWFAWVNCHEGRYRILARRIAAAGLEAGEVVTIYESENPLARPDLLVIDDDRVVFAWDEYADMRFAVRTREIMEGRLGPVGDFPAPDYANEWEPHLASAGGEVLVCWQAVPGSGTQGDPRAALMHGRETWAAIARPEDDQTWRVRCCDGPEDQAFLIWATRRGYRTTKLFMKAVSGPGLGATIEIEFPMPRTFINWFDCQYDGRLVLVYEAGGSVFMYDVDARRLTELAARGPADTSTVEPDGSKPEPRGKPRRTVEYDGRTLNLYFGDYHNHTSFSDGRAYPDISYLLARDVRGLDFMGVSDHDNTTTPGEFAWNCEVCDCLTRDGEYVCLYDYELNQGWTQHGFGHWNVLFRKKGEMFHYREGMTPDDLYSYANSHDLIAIPHHIGVVWAPHCWDYFDPVAEPVVEFCSIHGVYESMETCSDTTVCVEGSMIVDGLARGYHFGVVGGSDYHNCFAACLEEVSMTGAYAEELTRESVLDAFRKRRTYATTGDKIVLDFRCNGRFMGEELSTDEPLHFTAFMKSDDPIVRAEVVSGGSVIISEDVGAGEASYAWDCENPRQAAYFYLRVTAESGERAWSSPIYIAP
jgi:hypothetical protein